jgi:CelD/BcsL family acetyltransferase involved in cellulose biosynthesis
MSPNRMAIQSGPLAPSLSPTEEQVRLESSSVADLRVDIIDADQLCGALADRWSYIRHQNPRLASPYFSLDFVKAVARVRNDVEIAVVRRGENIEGFVPFQRSRPHIAEPIGGRLNDVHGVIVSDDSRQFELIQRVMQSCGLTAFGFHAIATNDPNLEQYAFREVGSYFIDLRQGWQTYQQWAMEHSSTVARQPQKTRSLQRRFGPIRLEFDCRRSDVLEKLIELKRAKYQRANTFDILSVQWASDLLRELHGVEQPGFEGVLSALYAGDELVAVHFGMMTDQILHYWFPVYDPVFSKYSPGTELILRVAEESSRRGIEKVDLGYGDDAYKFRFCNARENLICGQVTFNRFAFAIAKRRFEIRQRLKGIPLKPLAKSILRGVFPGFGQWNFK